MSRRCFGCMEPIPDDLAICPYCGQLRDAEPEEPIFLNYGTVLNNRYLVGRSLGFGSVGIKYIGFDNVLQQKVAIREYLPGEYATRSPGDNSVRIFTGDKNIQFQLGMESFITSAKRLAKFQNEGGIVKVFDSFYENNTAYTVMEFLEGETLTSYLEKYGLLTEIDAIRLLLPAINSLKTIHGAGMLHQDISPDNIFITKTGDVKLVDFGVERYAGSSNSRSLSLMVKSGYSPEEQYRLMSDQGTYTDVYALGATLYKMITGKTPPDALERKTIFDKNGMDILVPPIEFNYTVSEAVNVAILNAMNIDAGHRTPDIETFLYELSSNVPAKRINPEVNRSRTERRAPSAGQTKRSSGIPLWVKLAIPIILLIALIGGVFAVLNLIKAKDEEGSKPSTEATESSSSESSQSQDSSGGSDSENSGVSARIIVPNVIGMKKDEAIDKLEKQGFIVDVNVIENSNAEPDKVIEQEPSSGRELEHGSKVIIHVISSDIKIPNIKGKSLSEAKAALKDAGVIETNIEVYPQYTSNNANTNEVLDVHPDREKITKNEKITLYVSLKKVTINSASASSTLPEEGFGDYNAENVFDGKVETSWTEGAGGDGIGEYITLSFDETNVYGFRIRNGYQKVDPKNGKDLYYENNSIRRIGVSTTPGGSDKQSFDLKNGQYEARNEQEIILNSPIKTNSLTFTIEEIYRGTISSWHDTCISEIVILAIDD